MKKTILSMILIMVGTISLFAQAPGAKFVPDVRISFIDGTYIELSDFEIHSRRKSPQHYYDRSGSFKTDIPFKTGNLWRELSFKDIRKMSFLPNKNIHPFLVAEIVLLSFDSLKGEIPAVPSVMWEYGSAFFLNGAVKVMGRESSIKLSIREVKELKRDEGNPDVFILTTQKDEVKTLTSPYLTRYWHGSNSTFSKWKVTKDYDTKLHFMIEGIDVNIHMGDIDSLAFLPESKDVFIRLKDGNEAMGTIKSGIAKIKGGTKSGLTWYQSLSGEESGWEIILKSIKFL